MSDEEFRKKILKALDEIQTMILCLVLVVAVASCTGCVAREPRPEPCEIWMTGRDGGWTCVSRDTFERWARKNLPAG